MNSVKEHCLACGKLEMERQNVKGKLSVAWKSHRDILIRANLYIRLCNSCGESIVSGEDAKDIDRAVRITLKMNASAEEWKEFACSNLAFAKLSGSGILPAHRGNHAHKAAAQFLMAIAKMKGITLSPRAIDRMKPHDIANKNPKGLFSEHGVQLPSPDELWFLSKFDDDVQIPNANRLTTEEDVLRAIEIAESISNTYDLMNVSLSPTN